MAGNLASVGNNGIVAGKQAVGRSGSERQAQRDIGKALASNDIAAAKIAVASFKTEAARQGTRTEFQNAVKALDEALKAGDAKGATTAFSQLQQTQSRGAPRQNAPAEQTRARQQEASARPSPTQQTRVRQQEAPARAAPADQTRVRQQEGQTRQVQQSSQQDFITRQDLAAKAARNAGPVEQPGTGVGKFVDTQA
jgi:hypothetical protein